MEESKKNNPTKSIAWLAIKKDTQEKLIDLYVKHFLATSDKSYPYQNCSEYQDQCRIMINYELGIKTDRPRFIDRLKGLLEGRNSGKLVDQMKDHIEKFDLIESAVINLAKARQEEISKKI